MRPDGVENIHEVREKMRVEFPDLSRTWDSAWSRSRRCRAILLELRHLCCEVFFPGGARQMRSTLEVTNEREVVREMTLVIVVSTVSLEA
jgi:hypothetical protein